MSAYLKQEQKIDIKKMTNKLLYFLPISNCTSCKESALNLKMINSLDKIDNLIIFIIGMSDNSIYKNKVKQIKNKCLFDAESIIDKYQTGVNKPLLLKVINGKIVDYKIINDMDVMKAKKYILKNGN